MGILTAISLPPTLPTPTSISRNRSLLRSESICLNNLIGKLRSLKLTSAGCQQAQASSNCILAQVCSASHAASLHWLSTDQCNPYKQIQSVFWHIQVIKAAAHWAESGTSYHDPSAQMTGHISSVSRAVDHGQRKNYSSISQKSRVYVGIMNTLHDWFTGEFS